MRSVANMYDSLARTDFPQSIDLDGETVRTAMHGAPDFDGYDGVIRF